MFSNIDMKKRKKLSTVLKSKKFYIFMKNHSLHTKYEAKLKTLGAVVSPFLDKEINYVLTDTPGCNGKVPVTVDTLNVLSPCYSVSPATPVSGEDCCTTKRTRTRAEAMLERIPVQTHVASLNPIANAVSWNIPVYSIEFKWLDKKLAQIQLVNERSDFKCEANTRIFEKKYLKLENVFVNHYRPEFKEVSKWPCIDTNTLAGSCPFDRKIFKKSSKKENADKKKESERMNRTCNKTANEAGYCEICAVHYSDLSQHVSSNSHQKFTTNEKNYADLDNCIKTRSVEAFLAAHNSTGSNSQSKESNSNELMGRNLRKSVSLHLNNNNENSAVTRSLSNAKLLADESLKQPLQVQCNGFTNYHLRKTAAKSDSALIRSPGYYSSKDLLRESRKPCGSCPEGVPQNKDHQQLSPAKEENVHRLRSRKNLFLPSILIGTTAEDGPNRTRAGISPQTPTSNHFLRSSASPKSHHATRGRIQTVAGEDEKKNSHKSDQQGNSGIYFTRSKLSSATSNEGESKRNSRSSVSPREENHTNGRQKRKHSVVSDDDERRDSSPRNVPSYQSRRASKNNECDSLQSNGDKGQKKRLSYEEKFLEDNREYYKVEMLRTKLRSTEFYCNQEINQTVPTIRKDVETKTEIVKGTDENDQPVVMRFRKVKQRKQSALNLLNLEAENFLFGPPKREDGSENSSSESDDDDKRECTDDDQNEQSEKSDESKKEKPNNLAKAGRRTKTKKRRTHAEVFIHDNLDYYRFEISGSRLRHQNSEGADVLVKNEPEEKPDSLALTPSCSSASVVKVKEETVTDEENESQLPLKKRGKNRRKATSESEKENEEKAPEKEPEDCTPPVEITCCPTAVPAQSIHFSFESIPSKEPWYKTFQRYDSCDEFYIPISNTYIPKFQKIPNSRNTPARVASTPNEVTVSPLQRRKRRSRIGRLIVEDKPRKSPRCHASTLAILSSLTNHRRRSRKIHAVETRRSRDNRPARSEPKAKVIPAVDTALEYEKRLKEAVNSLAKDADEHFIDVFADEDCRDRYLQLVKKDQKVPEPEQTEDDAESHCCMQLDEEIFRDQDFLNCFIGTSDTIAGDMATFMDNAQRCSSMETAQDEESVIPRSNDLLSRLCREDYSCNSSDCGASSTCEFLGFAEDGRTVSRKRKRKRPNMTGWPHNNRRRRNIRFSDVSQRNIETNGSRETEASSSQPMGPDADNENVSEADSECTDDDMPLSQIVSRKRRRTNSTESAEDSATNSSQKEQPSETNESTRVSLRRSSKSGEHASSLPNNRRSSQNQHRNRTKRRRRN